MALRRRELRCCFLLVFLAVVVVSTFMFGLDYLQPQMGDVSFPKMEVPDWLRTKFKPAVPEEFFDEQGIEEPNPNTIPAPTYTRKPSPTGQSGPAVLGPYDLTTIPSGAHIQGFTVLDSLYMRDGTFFVVTADESQFPSTLDMIAKPIIKAEGVDSEPTDQDLLFLHPSTEILGGRVIRIAGLSVIVNDPPSTMNNFYNWWGEIILGAWRVYSQRSVEGNSTLPLPSRFILPAVSNGEWRDKAEMTGPLMRIAFPHASVEQSDYWQDLVKLNSTVVFDRVILVSREAAYRHPYASRWLKMISGAMKLDIPTNFWQPIRDIVVDNMLGYLPILNESGAVVAPSQIRPSTKPVVTYISRQESTRRLDEKDHEALIDALRALEDEGICEFHILEMERSTLLEQIKLTSTTTILVGVHGVGLTHQLWMPQSPKATLLEIVWPKAYVFDHEIIARNLGHKHYAVWNDTEITYPEGNYYKGIYHGDEFNSNAIPVYGPTVVKIIKDRLSF